MIITLKNANFSLSNIGVLNAWNIIYSIGYGANYNGPAFVNKGQSYSGTITLMEDYEFLEENIEITMGGNVLGTNYYSISEDKTSISIYIQSVNNTVKISIPTRHISSGDINEGESTALIWYIDNREKKSKISTAANIAGRGWTLHETNNDYAQIVGKPINTWGFFTTKDSQQLVIMKAPYKGAPEEDCEFIAMATATAVDGFATVSFPTVTLAQGEYLVIGCAANDNIHMFYTQSNTVGENLGFYSRVPKVYGSGDAWTEFLGGTFAWSFGYQPEA